MNTVNAQIRGPFGSLPLTVLTMMLMLPAFTFGQRIWTDIPEVSVRSMGDRQIIPQKYRTMAADLAALQQLLTQAPMEQVGVATRTSPTVLSLPLPDGSMARFSIVESPIMAPELGTKYPEIKTYLGQGIDDPYATLRCDFTSKGFHAMILSPDGTVFIDPYQKGDQENYISYYKRDFVPTEDKIMIEYNDEETEKIRDEAAIRAAAIPSGNNLRTYRLALACDSNYYKFQGGTDPQVMAAVVTSINRVNQVYEAEVAIRMVLIGNTDALFFDGGTMPYPFTATGACALRPENQTAIDDVVGNSAYDIGHLFAMSAGGCATGNSICNNSLKAWGVTGTGNPVGDPFDIDYVSHEMGHQFNGSHTWNGTQGSCSGGQYQAASAYEPGSGSTIMAYAGICGTDDLQPNSDPYFHTRSFDQIVSYSTTGTGNSCPVVSSTGNGIPSANAGGDYTIPISTPFKLTGSGSDPNGDALTFCWEEFDLGPAGPPNVSTTTGPIFRSFNPVVVPSRTFPKLSDILNNTATKGEVLPSIGRTMTFRLTTRDNRAGGGGVDYDAMILTVDGSIGPFSITSFNSPTTLCPGAQTVTWNVNGADALAANVNILLSYDGGLTFSENLALNTLNDGSQEVNIPCTYSTTARIKVESVGNVFFDISNANVTVGDNTPPTFTDPVDVTIYKDAMCNYNASVAVTGDVTNESDNCTMSLNATFADLVSDGTCDGETVITRTWTLEDNCRNTTTKMQVITIQDNTPPTFTDPADVTIYKDAMCNYNASVAVTGDVTNESDNCTMSLNATFADQESDGTCDGESIINRTWTLEDDCLNKTTKVQVITVQDITPPTFSVPADITIYKDENCDYDASISETGDVTDEMDNCDMTLDATFTDVVVPGSCIGEEYITRTWSLTDDCGNNTMHVQSITAQDMTGPVIADIFPNPAVLWPPNHKMRDVTINYTAVDNCSPVINMLSVASNEPVEGNGDGNTSPDWIVIDDHHVKLRAERSGEGTGRVYTITITSTDDCGNTSTATTAVLVPHDMTDPLALATPQYPVLMVDILPNPTNGNFNITVGSDDVDHKIQVSIYDIFGRTLEERLLYSGARLSVGYNYPAGNYVLRVTQGDRKSEVRQLIKIQ